MLAQRAVLTQSLAHTCRRNPTILDCPLDPGTPRSGTDHAAFAYRPGCSVEFESAPGSLLSAFDLAGPPGKRRNGPECSGAGRIWNPSPVPGLGEGLCASVRQETMCSVPVQLRTGAARFCMANRFSRDAFRLRSFPQRGGLSREVLLPARDVSQGDSKTAHPPRAVATISHCFARAKSMFDLFSLLDLRRDGLDFQVPRLRRHLDVSQVRSRNQPRCPVEFLPESSCGSGCLTRLVNRPAPELSREQSERLSLEA